MSESTTHTTELTSQYVSQVTSDLEHNTKEQERITTELAALHEQLATLQRDHTVLLNMQQALGVPASPPEPTSTSGATVPSPRKKSASASGTRPSAQKAPSKRAQGKAEVVAKTAQPTLVDLIHQHVAEQREPRSAAEIAEVLRQAHPKRTIDTKVVRTTLENLVAKSRIQRTKQGSSVFYTAASTPEPAAVSKDEVQPDTAA
ncbi:MAG: BlaI/MecI/CopY family transcriptional regulator [Streptomyces sp.]|uniref:BlaI/MecI/CopY family transcriptional regulator n=1 Tax=Streptomyces sp. TaxID=1931 RepID=UPI0025E94114|nr:BlaI/MecI/CopY family transcriptional regulator [Streptomyces sp.]MBW8797504.1 BlaI/MecI/CopY family transcriptional regulator [Streptomyces sp.]